MGEYIYGVYTHTHSGREKSIKRESGERALNCSVGEYSIVEKKPTKNERSREGVEMGECALAVVAVIQTDWTR